MEEQPRPPPSPPQPPAQLDPEEMEPGTPEPDDGLDPITRYALPGEKVAVFEWISRTVKFDPNSEFV